MNLGSVPRKSVCGTRMGARAVAQASPLPFLAEGATIDEILKDFPTLRDLDVRAAIAFAAALAQEDLPVQAVVR
jgi:uncharacterized protein (DUF433 family)